MPYFVFRSVPVKFIPKINIFCQLKFCFLHKTKRQTVVYKQQKLELLFIENISVSKDRF